MLADLAPSPFTTDAAKGTKAWAKLAAKLGLALDDTPIIKTQSDLDSLTKAGYVVQTRRATTETGRAWVVSDFESLRTTGDHPKAEPAGSGPGAPGDEHHSLGLGCW